MKLTFRSGKEQTNKWYGNSTYASWIHCKLIRKYFFLLQINWIKNAKCFCFGLISVNGFTLDHLELVTNLMHCIRMWWFCVVITILRSSLCQFWTQYCKVCKSSVNWSNQFGKRKQCIGENPSGQFINMNRIWFIRHRKMRWDGFRI